MKMGLIADNLNINPFSAVPFNYFLTLPLRTSPIAVIIVSNPNKTTNK